MNSNVKEEIEKYWEEKESLNFSDPDNVPRFSLS